MTLVGLAASSDVTPFPASDTAAGELAALLTIETPPVALPVAAGENLTVNEVVCPVARVRGRVSPLRLNPVPVTLACDTVTLPVPLLFSVTVCVLLLPNATFPKLRLVGLAASSRVTPLPASDTVAGELAASLTIETPPVTLPAAVGENFTVKVVLCPAARLSGRESPLRLNSVPVTLACDTVTLVVPVLLSVTV